MIYAGNVGKVVCCLHCKRDVAWDGETPIRAPNTPSAAARPPKWRIKWRKIAAGAFCLVMALPLLALGCWQAWLAQRSTSWPAADGVVLSSTIARPENDVMPGRGTRGTTSAAKIRYAYQVNGVNYQNDTVRFGNVYTNDLFGTASATVKRHPPGPATVYYDAQDPGVSVLEPGLHGLLLVRTGAGLLFTILGCVVLFNGVQPARPRE